VWARLTLTLVSNRTETLSAAFRFQTLPQKTVSGGSSRVEFRALRQSVELSVKLRGDAAIIEGIVAGIHFAFKEARQRIQWPGQQCLDFPLGTFNRPDQMITAMFKGATAALVAACVLYQADQLISTVS